MYLIWGASLNSVPDILALILIFVNWLVQALVNELFTVFELIFHIVWLRIWTKLLGIGIIRNTCLLLNYACVLYLFQTEPAMMQDIDAWLDLKKIVLVF